MMQRGLSECKHAVCYSQYVLNFAVSDKSGLMHTALNYIKRGVSNLPEGTFAALQCGRNLPIKAVVLRGNWFCVVKAALSGGRETGTAEQRLANEDPAEAFHPVAQLQKVIKASGLSRKKSRRSSCSSIGGGDEDGRKGGGFARQAVADLLPG